MQVTVHLKDGSKLQFPDADIQKKDNGAVIAVFDRRTYRIIAEFRADQVAAYRCEPFSARQNGPHRSGLPLNAV
jgi:hypothetical protein